METSAEEYRTQILKTIKKINSTFRLRRLYAVAHCMMLREIGETDRPRAGERRR